MLFRNSLMVNPVLPNANGLETDFFTFYAMADNYYDKMADEEAYWKSRETEWLGKFKKTPLYAELVEEFEETSLETGLEHLAKSRTRYYRYGPDAVVEFEKKATKFETDARFFLIQLQEKKYYDACLGWMIGDVHLEGIYTPFQLNIGKGSMLTCPFIGPVRPEEIDFLRHLLEDEDYIRSGEYPQFDSGIPEVDEIEDWQKERDPEEEFPENYPVFFRKYDEWFNQSYRLHAPLLRLEKYLQLREVAWEKRRAEMPPPAADPEEGKPYHMDYEEMAVVCAEWFRKHEPLKMRTWFEANEKFERKESVYDSTQFYDAMDALNDSFVKPYPDPNLVWHEALKVEGRRIWFRDIASALDAAYTSYQKDLASGTSLIEKDAFKKEWGGDSGINDNEKRMIFEAQKILGEPETLNYYPL